MDGTRKYAWWSGLPKGSPDFFCALPVAAGSDSGGHSHFLASSFRGSAWERGVALPFPIDKVDELPQPPEVVAVEAEPQPRQVGDVRVVALRLQGRRLLVSPAADDDVGKPFPDSPQHLLGQPPLQPQHQVALDVAHAVV